MLSDNGNSVRTISTHDVCRMIMVTVVLFLFENNFNTNKKRQNFHSYYSVFYLKIRVVYKKEPWKIVCV